MTQIWHSLRSFKRILDKEGTLGYFLCVFARSSVKENSMRLEMVLLSLTNEVSPALMILGLFPVAWPAGQNGVVLKTTQPSGLDQVWCGVPHVGGDDNLTEALHLLRLHQLPQRLWDCKKNINPDSNMPMVSKNAVLLNVSVCFYVCHLFSLLPLRKVLQVSSLQRCAHDGQTLPSLQLTGQRQQTRLLHIQFRVHADQD